MIFYYPPWTNQRRRWHVVGTHTHMCTHTHTQKHAHIWFINIQVTKTVDKKMCTCSSDSREPALESRPSRPRTKSVLPLTFVEEDRSGVTLASTMCVSLCIHKHPEWSMGTHGEQDSSPTPSCPDTKQVFGSAVSQMIYAYEGAWFLTLLYWHRDLFS